MVQRYLIAAALLASGGSLAAAQDVPVTDVSGQPATEGAFNVFRGISGPIENEVSDNDYSNNEAPSTPAVRNKSLREAMARANADKNPSIQITEKAIQEARDIIETGREMTERNKIAANRALAQGANLNSLKMDHTNFFTPEDSKQIDESYRKVLTYDAQKKAQDSVEAQNKAIAQHLSERAEIFHREGLDRVVDAAERGGPLGGLKNPQGWSIFIFLVLGLCAAWAAYWLIARAQTGAKSLPTGDHAPVSANAEGGV